MTKLKVQLLTIALLALTITANAQLSLGVKGGLNVSTISDMGMDFKPGFHLGVMGQYMLSEKLGVESGLYYSMMGAKLSESAGGLKVSASVNPSYLQLPIQLLYKFKVGQDLSLYPTAGIYFGYGIAGKSKGGISLGKEGVSGDADFFGDYMNRFDMGFGLGLNLQYQKFIVGLGYDQGFLDISKGSLTDAYNSNVKLSLGYLF